MYIDDTNARSSSKFNVYTQDVTQKFRCSLPYAATKPFAEPKIANKIIFYISHFCSSTFNENWQFNHHHSFIAPIWFWRWHRLWLLFSRCYLPPIDIKALYLRVCCVRIHVIAHSNHVELCVLLIWSSAGQ